MGSTELPWAVIGHWVCVTCEKSPNMELVLDFSLALSQQLAGFGCHSVAWKFLTQTREPLRAALHASPVPRVSGLKDI